MDLTGESEIGALRPLIHRESKCYLSHITVSGAGLWLFAPPALAEVSDKILPIPGMWVQALLIGGIAILAGRFRWWLGVPFLILPIVIALSTFGLRHGSDLGPAIIKEQGETYFHHFYASSLLAASLVALGIWIGWRRRRTTTDNDEAG